MIIFFFITAFLSIPGARAEFRDCESMALTSFFIKANNVIEVKTNDYLEGKYEELENSLDSKSRREQKERLNRAKESAMRKAETRRPLAVCDNPRNLKDMNLDFLEDEVYQHCQYNMEARTKVGADGEAKDLLARYLIGDALLDGAKRNACREKAYQRLKSERLFFFKAKDSKRFCRKIIKMVNKMYGDCYRLDSKISNHK